MEQTSILVVDDELETRELLYGALTGSGYEVSTAPGGEAALTLLDKERPDLLLLDMEMPGMDGVQTLERIRSFDDKLNIVMLICPGDEDLEEQARKAGASGFLPKGLRIETFLEMIPRMLSQKEPGFRAQGEPQGKILVVDDEETIRALLSEFLTGKGYQVFLTASGQEALRIVEKEKPELVLLDIRMPGMDGILTLKKIKAMNGKVGVIMITANQDAELARQALKLGAYDYIGKPLDFKYLERSVWSTIRYGSPGLTPPRLRTATA